MKICITSRGDDLSASVDPRFGRCQYFLFVDSGTMQYEAAGNPALAAEGAGIQAAQFVGNKGAKAVLTGDVGPNAYKTLQAAGVMIVTGVSGPVREAVEKFEKGELQYAGAPSVESHAGMKR